jgi:hypothetical protein
MEYTVRRGCDIMSLLQNSDAYEESGKPPHKREEVSKVVYCLT